MLSSILDGDIGIKDRNTILKMFTDGWERKMCKYKVTVTSDKKKW